MRESQRQSGFNVSQRKKKPHRLLATPQRSRVMSKLKLALRAAQTDGVVKARRGKTHVISGGSSVGQTKLLQLILGYIYILNTFKAISLVKFYSLEIHNQ